MAIARPMPRLAPVTTAIFPFSDSDIFSSFLRRIHRCAGKQRPALAVSPLAQPIVLYPRCGAIRVDDVAVNKDSGSQAGPGCVRKFRAGRSNPPVAMGLAFPYFPLLTER